MIPMPVIIAAVVAAVSFTSGWTVSWWRAERQILAIQAEHAQALATAESAARAREQSLVTAKHQAEVAHAVTKKQSQRAIAGARSELDRLRDVLATRATDADSTASTRTDGATCPERELLGEGAGHLADMAAEADRLSATLTGLQGYVQAVCR